MIGPGGPGSSEGGAELGVTLSDEDPRAPASARVREARAFAAAGAERLRRFQHADADFSVHGRGPTDPWLTAVGLGELAHLSLVVDVEPDRLEAAARGLAGFQDASGRISAAARRWRSAPVLAGEAALTAYAAWAWQTAAREAGLELPPAAARGLERALAWLEDSVAAPDERPTYELAFAARAFLLDPTRASLAVALARTIADRAEVDAAAGQASWPPGPTFTGRAEEAAAVEATALAGQVLLATGHDDVAQAALAWLAGRRGDRGYGGTRPRSRPWRWTPSTTTSSPGRTAPRSCPSSAAGRPSRRAGAPSSRPASTSTGPSAGRCGSPIRRRRRTARATDAARRPCGPG